MLQVSIFAVCLVVTIQFLGGIILLCTLSQESLKNHKGCWDVYAMTQLLSVFLLLKF